MGTPEFAVKSLEAIIEEDFKVVGVVTAPDRPAGRGRKLQQSDVKRFAEAKGLKVLQPTNLKSDDFQQQLNELNPDVQVVVAFRMLPESVWKLPKYGTFNLHASLLPQYRGAAPINWAIINGERKTGVSTFFIDEKIDTGSVILQKELKIDKNENVGELHDRLMEVGAELVVKTLRLIAKDKVKSKPQVYTENLRAAPKLSSENTKIDWNDPIDTIHNLIRGLSPYPVAWSYVENSIDEEFRVKIYDAEKVYQEHHLPNGTISVQGDKLKVAVPHGFILIKEIQLPGKKRMRTKDLLNGFNFAPEAKMR